MGEWIPAGGEDPVDCSLAADARDAAPYLPRGRVSNVTAQRLRAKILRARKREATKPLERVVPATDSHRVAQPRKWPTMEDFSDSHHVPMPREEYFSDHGKGNWETRTVPHQPTDPSRPLRAGNASLAEVHGGRFETRASDGDGGQGVSEWTDANCAEQSNLHSGVWQRRAGARLAGKFEPRKMRIGYDRGRGGNAPGNASCQEVSMLPAPREQYEDTVYVELDPNLMDSERMAESVFAHRVAVETEAAELSAKRRLDTTLRVHSDSKLPPKDAPSRKPLLKPCWIESEPVRASYADNAIFHQGHTERIAPWATLGNVCAMPTDVGVSARIGGGSILNLQASHIRRLVEDDVENVPAVSSKVCYFGRHSHHSQFHEVRRSRATEDLRVRPLCVPASSARRQIHSPAVEIHKSHFETEGLGSYAPVPRKRDEVRDSLPPPPSRDGKMKVKYFDHRSMRRTWTVVDVAVPVGERPDESLAAGSCIGVMRKSIRPTSPKLVLRGRDAQEAKTRDFPYGPCTF